MAEKRPRLKRPLQLANLLESVFAGKPLQKRLREAHVWEVWQEAVGQQIAARAKPLSFRDGILTVAVAGSAWLQQLSLMKQEIIQNVNEAAEDEIVTDIFFKQGKVTAIEAPPEPTPLSKKPLTADKKAKLAELAAPLEDQELRDALISLIAAQQPDGRRKPTH
jgi:hypothetical protein